MTFIWKTNMGLNLHLTEKRLLTALYKDPDNVDGYLAYADWLEKHDPNENNLARAMCIRQQIEQPTWPNGDGDTSGFEDLKTFSRADEGWREVLGGKCSGSDFKLGIPQGLIMSARDFTTHGAEVLRTLPVQRVRFQHVGRHMAAVAGCRELGLVRKLDFPCMPLNNEAIGVLAGSPYVRALQVLDISAHRIGNIGAQLLLQSEKLGTDLELVMNVRWIHHNLRSQLSQRFRLQEAS